MNLPVYLEPQVQAWLGKVAGKRGEEVSKLVNRLLKKEIDLVEAAR
jgi:transcription antitermination factor NusA-like protein